jgi:hypothetical protein
MKKVAMQEILTILLVLLFSYTAVSKFLDYDKFVFQMRLAPVPVMAWLAPILGWLVPIIEMILVIGLSLSLFIPRFLRRSLAASVALLSLFEIYIVAMLLTGHHLPCTCGGIISTMSWQQHLVFNAAFILLGVLAIRQNKKQVNIPTEKLPDDIKDLSRA